MGGAWKACRDLGPKYDLIANAQWQSIARNIETVPWNWSTSVFATGEINRGHTDNVPASALAADTNDDNACFETGDTCSSTIWHKQRRTHKLTNGEIIWDLAGNVWEWNRDEYADLGVNPIIPTGWSELYTLSTQNAALFSSANITWGSVQGLGMAYGGAVGTLMRGGYWGNGQYAGIFTFILNYSRMYPDPIIGFRCVFTP